MVKRYKTILIFILVFIAVFAFDQWVKSLTLSGLRWQSEYLDLTYALNTGVAFSMFSFFRALFKIFTFSLDIGACYIPFVAKTILKRTFSGFWYDARGGVFEFA